MRVVKRDNKWFIRFDRASEPESGWFSSGSIWHTIFTRRERVFFAGLRNERELRPLRGVADKWGRCFETVWAPF